MANLIAVVKIELFQKKIILLIKILIMKRIISFAVIFMFLPYLTFSQQHIDIGIFNMATNNEVEVRLRPDFNITNNFLTNVQFTISWDSASNVAITPASIPPYLIDPQGTPVHYDGKAYQIFASSPNCILNWSSGQEYVVLSFAYSDCVDFEIIKDQWTQINNGDFYVELLGIDHTGVFYKPSADILPDVYLGKDTSICVYSDLELDAGNPGATFLWSSGETTQKIIVDGATLGVGSYNYSVTVTTQNGCSSSDSRLVIIDPCTGLNDPTHDRIKIFPNPSHGEIYIDTADKRGNFHLNIVNICGTEIRSFNMAIERQYPYKLDLSELTAGLYFLKLSCDDLYYFNRLILLN